MLFHPRHNGDVDPYQLGASSNRKLWWRCGRCGLEWQGRRRQSQQRKRLPALRPRATRPRPGPRPRRADARGQAAQSRRGAPSGSQRRARPPPARGGVGPQGLVALSRLRPRLAGNRQEHGGSRPRLPQLRSPARRAQAGPRAGRALVALRRPDLVAELHPTHNRELVPYQLAAGSSRRVWWQCGACHRQWRARVSDRNRGAGCPRCGRAQRRQAAPRPKRALALRKATRSRRRAAPNPQRRPGPKRASRRVEAQGLLALPALRSRVARRRRQPHPRRRPPEMRASKARMRRTGSSETRQQAARHSR
jgi:hypothetical protein